jgi:parvulin-like peptidyl-prolyl isomerase
MRNTPSTPRRVRAAHESKSATVRAAAAAPSRRQLSKWQREQRQQRSLYVAIGVLVVLVLAILAGGLIYDNVIRSGEVVAQIGPDSITAAGLVDAMRPAARRIDAQAKQQGGGTNDPSLQQYVDTQKRDLPDATLNNLIDEHLIAQEAARRGISVTPAEVDERERQSVADFNNATNPAPTPAPTSTPEGAAAGATPAASPTPDTSASPTAIPTPTAVPTLDTAAYGPALQKLLDQSGYTEAELRDELQKNLLREKVQTAIGQEQAPDTQEQVHARHILVATEDQARDVLQQLQNGADFATLASQLSTDPGSKSKGGDLGWFPRGIMDKAFEDAAFALQPGQLSDVVHGTNGYHVIQVLERDPNRAVDPSQLQTLRQKAFSDWLSSRRSSQDVKLQLGQSERDWVLARIGVRP